MAQSSMMILIISEFYHNKPLVLKSELSSHGKFTPNPRFGENKKNIHMEL